MWILSTEGLHARYMGAYLIVSLTNDTKPSDVDYSMFALRISFSAGVFRDE